MTCESGPRTASVTLRVCARLARKCARWLQDAVLLIFAAFVLLLLSGRLFAAPGAAASSTPTPDAKPELQTALYLGTLFTLDQDAGQAIHRGQDLVTLRFVGTMRFPFGLRFGGRIDGTSLGTIDPNNLDLESFRTIEGYGAVSWSAKWRGLDLGPALAAGALIPIENSVTWRYEPLYAGGLRVGYGRSWLYLMAGGDGAADVACPGSGGVRAIFAGSVEFKRFAVIGDAVSGCGARVRGGFLYRIPVFW